MLFKRIETGQLVPIQIVFFVRIDLTDHIKHGAPISNQQTLLPVGGEVHVPFAHHALKTGCDRFFAQALV